MSFSSGRSSRVVPFQGAVLADAPEHRGHAQEPGDSLPLQGGERRIGLEARREVHRAAGQQRAHQDGGEAHDVRERQDAVEAVAGPHFAHHPGGRGDEQDVAVGQHDALGRAGGAGGVEQHGDPLRGVGGRGLGRHLRREGAERQRADAAGQVEGLGAVPLGMGAGVGRGGGGVEHAARAGVVADLVDLARAEAGVGDHGPGLGRRDRQDQGGLGDAVLGHHHDPVAWPDAPLPQPSAEERDVPGELAVGPGAIRFRQRGRVRRPLGPGLDHLVDPGGECRNGRSEPLLERVNGFLDRHALPSRVHYLNYFPHSEFDF